MVILIHFDKTMASEKIIITSLQVLNTVSLVLDGGIAFP